MTALNVFLAIMGVGITVLVVAGMVFLKPHHLVSPAVQTDLSDVERDRPAGPNVNPRPRSTPPAARPSREQVVELRGRRDDGDPGGR